MVENTNCYMKIPGVEGSAVKGKHKGDLTIKSLSVDISAQGEEPYLVGQLAEYGAWAGSTATDVNLAYDAAKVDIKALNKFLDKASEKKIEGDVKFVAVFETPNGTLEPRVEIEFKDCELGRGDRGYRLKYKELFIATWKMHTGNKQWKNKDGGINLATRTKAK